MVRPPIIGDPNAIRPEELRAVPCKACGSVWRTSRVLARRMVHRFRLEVKADARTEFFFCASCGVQVDGDGSAVGPDHPDRWPLKEGVTP